MLHYTCLSHLTCVLSHLLLSYLTSITLCVHSLSLLRCDHTHTRSRSPLLDPTSQRDPWSRPAANCRYTFARHTCLILCYAMHVCQPITHVAIYFVIYVYNPSQHCIYRLIQFGCELQVRCHTHCLIVMFVTRSTYDCYTCANVLVNL